jgi:SNF2 family DNA or RNA helicase
MQLELICPGALVAGILPQAAVTVTGVTWRGPDALELFYRDAAGRTDAEILGRADEARLELVSTSRSWAFDGDGAKFRLVCEAQRIRWAHLFDPHLAVHASQVDALPHQITAVYGDLLPRQPLRFLLADDPGAGKTIMTGLYLKELAMRGDLRRALIVCPGSLAEQWQEELSTRFGLDFEILTRDATANSRSGNPFSEKDYLIARLDQLSRGDEWQELLRVSEFDAIVVDEAHKMSASFFGGEMKATKRYRLGQLLGGICRHFLLLTATPHNGKEEDFQFFMALLDPDRFEGRFRSGTHTQDVSDLMRRRVKEELYRFNGTRLFPERRAYTVNYALSDGEALLYEAVTDYVREEMNRADKLDGKSGATVGFALTVLQRRLASSPAAIYQSIMRRRKRLEARLAEEKASKNGALYVPILSQIEADEADDFYDEIAPSEIEEIEDAIALQASASRTLSELAAEIRALERLERLAFEVRQSGTDRKWDELSRLLQSETIQGEGGAAGELFDAQSQRRKLIVFTEHRDTLSYLSERIRTLLGREEAVVTIHGGVSRDERRRVQEAFTQDREVFVLLATDAAGEGINLQRAHLMVNYDLPWNPNRIEQRFGRIHRIGQTEVCHLWNLVAFQTREGQVWQTLLEKLENQRESLGSGVFDVLGQCFEGNPLRQLLIDAVRYGDQPQVRAKLLEKLEGALDTEHLKRLLEERALATDSLSLAQVGLIRREMERAQARRLQPHYISQFFQEAFTSLGGDLKKREADRWEITRVPGALCERNRGRRETILPRYERITFEPNLVQIAEKPMATLVCPGHPLLDASIDLLLERDGAVLKAGTVLIDEENRASEVRALWMIEGSVQDGRTEAGGGRQIVSRRLQWVEMDGSGAMRDGGSAPYLDYRAASNEEKAALGEVLSADWLQSDLESAALDYAASQLVPQHLGEVRTERQERLAKTRAAVNERLTKEIAHWDGRALELATQEEAGKPNAKLNSDQARRRADDLEARLQSRLQSLENERHLSARPPVVIGGALVVPRALLPKIALSSEPSDSQNDSISKPKSPEESPPLDPQLKKKLDELAVQTILITERAWGHSPQEMEHNNPGYDIESLDGKTGNLRFLEVKGKLEEYGTVTVSRTQILTALNKPDDWYLVIVPIAREGEGEAEILTPGEPFYLQRPFTKEPDFAATSVNFDLHTLLGGNAEGSNIL